MYLCLSVHRWVLPILPLPELYFVSVEPQFPSVIHGDHPISYHMGITYQHELVRTCSLGTRSPIPPESQMKKFWSMIVRASPRHVQTWD